MQIEKHVKYILEKTRNDTNLILLTFKFITKRKSPKIATPSPLTRLDMQKVSEIKQQEQQHINLLARNLGHL